MYQGDAAANEKHRGGKTTKTQVPAVDSFAIPTSLAISKNFKDFFISTPVSLFCKICSQVEILTNIPTAGGNVAFWALLPISWSLLRPQKKYSETLIAKGTWRSGEW